jgi:hypothetical protein
VSKSNVSTKIVEALVRNSKREDLLDYLIEMYRPRPQSVNHQPSQAMIEKLKKEKGIYGYQLEASTTKNIEKQWFYLNEGRPSILYNLSHNINISDGVAQKLTEEAIKRKSSNIAIGLIRCNLGKVPKGNIKDLIKLISFRQGKGGVEALAEGMLLSNYEIFTEAMRHLPKTLYNSSHSTAEALFSALRYEIRDSSNEVSTEILAAIFDTYKKLPVEDFYSLDQDFIAKVTSDAQQNARVGNFSKELIALREQFEKGSNRNRYEPSVGLSQREKNGLSTEYESYRFEEEVTGEHRCSIQGLVDLSGYLNIKEDILDNHKNWATPFNIISNYTESERLDLLERVVKRTKNYNKGSYGRTEASTAYEELFAHDKVFRKLIANRLHEFNPNLIYQPLIYSDYVEYIKDSLLNNVSSLSPLNKENLYPVIYYIYEGNESFELKIVYLKILLSRVKNDRLAASILSILDKEKLIELLSTRDKKLKKKVVYLYGAYVTGNPLVKGRDLNLLPNVRLADSSILNWSGRAIASLGNYLEANLISIDNLEIFIKSIDNWDSSIEDLVIFANKV